ncbi:hypothetical protein OIU79_002986, partial [Salix purpurea]
MFLSFCSPFVVAANKGFSFLAWLRNTSDLSLVADLPGSFSPLIFLCFIFWVNMRFSLIVFLILLDL